MTSVRLRECIRSKGLDFRIVELSRPTRTVREAAEALGVNPSLIVKTIIVESRGRYYAAIIPGDRRLNLKAVEKVTGGRARLAERFEVLEATGYNVGSVPPLCLPSNVQVLVDSSIMGRERVYGGGGSESSLLEFEPSKLVSAMGYTVGNFTF